MSRVALVAGPDAGHLVPAAGLAVRLAGAGHEVLVVTGPRWRGPLAAAGLPWAELPLPGPDVAGRLSLDQRLVVLPVALAASTVQVLAPFAPDVVVGDTLTRVAGLAAGALGVPWVELVPHPLADPSRALPAFGTGWWPYRRWRDGPIGWQAARQRRAAVTRRRAHAWSMGYDDPDPVRRLVATLPALEPPRPDWPLSATVVGPLAFEPSASDLHLPTGAGPLVLVIGSTASGRPANLLAMALSALAPAAAAAGVRVVSPRFEGGPDGLPAWAAAGPGRLGPLLAAASVVVAPGGHGVVAAALSAGRPLVLLPGPGDQKEIAARVCRLGAGVVTAPSGLAAAVDRVLTGPDHTRCAAAAGRTGAGLPDPVELVVSAHLQD